MMHFLFFAKFVTLTSNLFIMQTVPDITNELKPLKHVIRNKFIKSTLNYYKYNDKERKLPTLPVKHGGLSVYSPTETCQIEFKNSRLVPHTMVKKAKHQDKSYDKSIDKSQQKQAEIKKKVPKKL